MYQKFDKLGFKPGDTVKCTKSDLPKLYEVGKTYKLEKHENSNRTITCDGFTGYSAEWEKVETEMKFKVGDKVRKKNGSTFGDGNIINTIREPTEGETYRSENVSWVAGGWISNSMIEIAFEYEYEDQWHLNDGKVTIPDDADKLEKDGSVVAFRKRKQPEFKFGDMVKTKSGNICIVVGKDQEGLYRVIGENMVHSVTIFTDSLTKI